MDFSVVTWPFFIRGCMTNDLQAFLSQGQGALEEADWERARTSFQAALDLSGVAEAWHGLGEACWWLGDLEGTLANFEKAYTAFRRRPDPARAVEMALRNALHAQFYLANGTAASGWIARARRLMEEKGLDGLRGELLVIESSLLPNPSASEENAREALNIARRAGDPDLELCALSSIGVALVRQGRIEEGLPLLDESMAGALSGDCKRLETAVFTSCDFMTACARGAAFERAMDGIRAAERFARRYGCPFLYAECRIIYGEVLLATGAWSQAETELRKAVELTRNSAPSYHAWALAGLAELRLSQGSLEEAERLVGGFEEHPKSVPVLARIHLSRGAPSAAILILNRRLKTTGEDRLEGALLLELLGEAELARGENHSARERGRRLVALDETRGCRLMRARGERLLGRSFAVTDTAAARPHLDAALSEFAELNLPYEAARTRLMLAQALRKHDPEAAIAEARAALGTLDGLGAAREADAAAELLRKLGVRAGRAASRNLEMLTRREREVFALLGEGYSNPKIAKRLFISPKTAEHHVCHILDKLDLKNRAEAAAEAVRRLATETVEK